MGPARDPESGRYRNDPATRERRLILAIKAQSLREKGWPWPMVARSLEVSAVTLKIARREAGLPDPLVELMEAADRRALARFRGGETVNAIARSRGHYWQTAAAAIERARKREREGIRPKP